MLVNPGGRPVQGAISRARSERWPPFAAKFVYLRGNSMDDTLEDDGERPIRAEDQDPAHWKADGWAARIVKNEDDDGWAVEMTRAGELEPALVGPWTMGRDKKNPKPLDASAFATLVRGANEVRARQLQQLHAQLHRSVIATASGGERIRVDLDVVPDEDDPHAILTVFDEAGVVATRSRVPADFKLSAETARRWLERPASDVS